MNKNTSSIVSKAWSFCNPLRDVGVGYGDYLEQLTYLLFLKMANEYENPTHHRKLGIPKESINLSAPTSFLFTFFRRIIGSSLSCCAWWFRF